MRFSKEEIQSILKVIELQHLLFLAFNVGVDYLTDEEIALLFEAGADVEELLLEDAPLYQAFYFGILSQALGDSRTKNLSYKDFLDFIKSTKAIPLSESQKNAYRYIQNRAFTDIRGLQQKIEKDINGVLVQEDFKEQMREVIKDEALRSIEERRSARDMVTRIQDRTGVYGRDFDRIAEYLMHEAYDYGRAMSLLSEEGGEDTDVYKDVYEGACKSCVRLYLTGDFGSPPKIFKLSELIGNGTNIGRKEKEWKPVIGPTHPYCFDEQTEVLTNQGWKFFKDLTLQELFLSVNLETEGSEWVEAVGGVKYQYDGVMHEIKSRDFDSLTTPNHRHVVKFDGWSKPNTARLVEGTKIPKDGKLLRTIPNWRGLDFETIEIGPLTFNTKDWFEFMGWYMSEGSISKHSEHWYEINITQQKEHYRPEIATLCKKLFDKVWVGGQDIVIPINTKKQGDEIVEHLKGVGTRSWEKAIPRYIKESSKELIEIFLLSFCKGDGTFNKSTSFMGTTFKGQRHHHTSSPQMSADLGELILKVGRRPSYTVMSSVMYKGYKCREVYKITECSNQYTRRLSNTEDRLKEISYSGMVYDVELKRLHTLVVRRNGRVWVSGNCRCTLRTPPEGFKWNPSTQAFDLRDENWKPKVKTKAKVEIIVQNN